MRYTDSLGARRMPVTAVTEHAKGRLTPQRRRHRVQCHRYVPRRWGLPLISLLDRPTAVSWYEPLVAALPGCSVLRYRRTLPPDRSDSGLGDDADVSARLLHHVGFDQQGAPHNPRTPHRPPRQRRRRARHRSSRRPRTRSRRQPRPRRGTNRRQGGRRHSIRLSRPPGDCRNAHNDADNDASVGRSGP